MRPAQNRRSLSPAFALVRAVAAGTLAAALWAAPALPASAAAGPPQGIAWGRYMHVASRAIPSPHRPNAVDSAVVVGPLRPNGGPASASASVENSCAGCSGTAVTLQVLTSPGVSTLTANNLATAYTTGDWASSAAVSVQIIATADARSIIANNSSIAVNEGCTGCNTQTVAIQYILVGRQQRDLSPSARSIVLGIEQALGVDLNAAASAPAATRSARAQSSAHDAVERARAVIAADTGAAVETRLQVDSGS